MKSAKQLANKYILFYFIYLLGSSLALFQAE